MPPTQPTVRTPSATELVAILSSRETTRIAKPVPIIAHIPRPRWWQRVLLLFGLACLGVFALFSVLTARAINDIQRFMAVEHQAPVAHVYTALPSPELLLNEQTFATALERMPDYASRLHLARAELLLARDDRPGAIAAYSAAAATSTGLPPGRRLRWAELLFDAGRMEDAQAVLKATDVSALDDEQRSRAVALTGRCLLALRTP